MASSIGTTPVSGVGTSFIPDLTDTANIQSALKLLYYGTTQAATTNGIYGSLASLQSQITATQAGVNVHETVKAATLVGTPIPGVYAAGTTDASGGTGIGAKITYSATGVVTIDGVTLALNDRILVKDGTTALSGINSIANGIYYVSTLGAVGVACVLTRAEDSNNSIAGEMGEGDFVFVAGGTAPNNNTSWVLTSSSATGTGPAGAIKIGTDPVTYIQFGSVTFGSQTANTFLAAPNGSAGTPTFRRIVGSDLSEYNTPTLGGQVLQWTAGLSATTWSSGTLNLPTSSSLTLSGGFALTLTQTASTNVTLPTSGTLATIDTAQTFSAIKTFGTTNTTAPFIIQQTPSTVSTTSTLSTAQLLTYVINTTSASPITVTLPTGTSMEAVQASAPPNGAAFDFYIVNSGAGIITMAGNTGNTLTTYGFGTTIAGSSGSAHFRTYKNATNSWTTLRLR